jgi:Fungal specific transcription factor domain
MVSLADEEADRVMQDDSRASGDSACYRYVKGTSSLDSILLEHVPFDGQDEASLRSGKYRKIGSAPGQYVEILSISATGDSRAQVQAQLFEKLAPADVDYLVKSYFDVVHSMFPILNENSFLAAYQSRSVDPLLLAAVCVTSGAWLATTQSISRNVNLSSTEVLLGEQLRASLDRPSIATLQAGLILIQCPKAASPHLSSQLTSLAFDLGLHQDCSEWNVDSQEKCSRKRLAWTLYAQDKWTALLYGRPPQISEANWSVQPLSLDDFGSASTAEERMSSTPNHGAALFMQKLVLAQILADILDTFYTLSAEEEVRACGHNGLRMVLERAKPVQIRLKDWFSSLPASLKMDAPDESQASCNGILHLAYFATEIALHRCIIRASVAPGTDSYVAHICRSAAKTRLISAMDFVNRLRFIHFKACWPLASVSNFGLIGSFGVLLRATAPTKEEAEFYRARLEEYRWTLSVSSRSAGFLDHALQDLDARTELLRYIPEKPEIAEFMAIHPGVYAGEGNTSDSQGSTFNAGRPSPFTGFASPSTSASSEQDLEDAESG